VFRPRGRLARLSLPKKNRTGQTKKPQGEMPPQIELAPDGDIGGGEISSGKKFREALSKANAGVVAAVLRETDSLDRRAVDALVYLLDVTAKDYGGWEDLCPHKLIFLKKRRGAPKDLEKHWVRDPQIAALVEHKTEKSRKVAVFDVGKEVGLGRSSIFAAMARQRSSKCE